MRLKIVALLAAVLLVSACETTPEATQNAAGTGESTSNTTATTGVQSESIDPHSIQYVQEKYGDKVFFDFDSSVIRADAEATIKNWATWMQNYPDVNVVIEGHCDERGTREYNLALGERRANAVKNVLVALGIDPSRISTISYGKERPAVEGHNEAAWAANRRGVLTLG
jgi:peptidoglycan-associated lipoprotein